MEDLKKIQEFFSKPLKEGTFDQGEIAIYMGHDDSGTTHIFKRGKGYYGYNDEFDFEAASKEELQQKLDKWGYELLAGSLEESKKLTFNDFVRMVRDDMMAGAAPDERPSEELVGKRAKAYYNDYLQGASVDDLFEATKEEENEFHTKLDKLVHKTFGPSSDEKEEMDENIAIQMAIAKAIADRKNKDKKKVKEYNTGIYYDPTKDNPTGRSLKTKEASKTGLEKVKDMLKKIMKEGDITIDDETEFKLQLKHLLDKHAIQKEDLSDYEEKEADYDKLYSDYLYKMVKEVAAEKGYSKFLVSKDNPKGETDGLTTATMNKILMNVIKDLDETIKLGKNLNEELCPKGKAYIKKRQAAGEKSSAYLSGRAVKVCKGQMKG